MRKNTPISNTEIKFDSDVKLISVTDLNGNISDCNDAFAQVSGFSRDELLGQPHNIVRHPDMPTLVFKIMWNHLKAASPWMGIIKNRCKNGDYYWVDAYVTPVTDKGKIIGYESVRSCPKHQDVVRAEKLYTRVNKGKGTRKEFPLSAPNIFLIVALILSVILLSLKSIYAFQSTLFISIVVYAFWSSILNNRKISSLSKHLNRSFSHELAAQSYTNKKGVLGGLEVSIISQHSHLTTVISRIESAAERVSHECVNCLNLVKGTKHRIDQQQSETVQVATAMNQITATIAEVAMHVSDTAEHAEIAHKLAKDGENLSHVTSESITGLRNTVKIISSSVAEVEEQTIQIADAANMIEKIAEKTNLLALNAAIEAARAGEQGRGFAVVAEEVRNLAKHTQNSTNEINKIVKSLANKSKEAVIVADKGAKDADKGLAKVLESGQMLTGIVSAISQISDMSTQIATAIEEQANVAEDVNHQVVNISTLADNSAIASDNAATYLRDLNIIADELHELVVRFK